MMSEIQVTSGEIRRKAAMLQRLNMQLNTRIGELENAERALGSMWEGDAKNAFHRNFEKDKAKMRQFYQAINKYIRVLGEAAQQYEAAERRNLAILSAGR